MYKSNFLNWLKRKMERMFGRDEADDVQIEYCLIRALSDYRDKELSNIHIDKDFDKRLMNRLEHIELENSEPYLFESPRNYKVPLTLSIGFAFVAVITFSFFNLDENTNPNYNKMPAQAVPTGIKTYSRMSLEEDPLIQELKNNPDNVRLLEKLEVYYSESGKKEHATEIHSMLETVSKKY